MFSQPRFLADVHLGRLARQLRMLGFDTAYSAAWSKPQLLKTAVSENRILLTRQTALAQNPFLQTFIIESEHTAAQLAQVIAHFGVHHIQPFTRCMVCNFLLEPVPKAEVLHLLQPVTIQEFHHFWQCPQCSRVYWQGSHYQRMMQQVNQLKKD